MSPSVGLVLAALLGAALPPPPDTVVRETYFGKVTIDHRAHLTRRTACASCHGPGRVSKLDFTPKIAHERCVGCHKQQEAGPVQCNGCHVKPVAPVAVAGVQLAGVDDGSVTPAATTVGKAATETGAAAALPEAGSSPRLATTGSAVPAGARPPRVPPGALRRVVQIGWSAGAGTGPALRLSSRAGRLTVTHSFDRIAGADDNRTLGLIGLGATLPLDRKWHVETVALGGFDLVEEPRLDWLPAVGARAGIEWLAQRGMIHGVQLSVTGVVDLSRASGRGIGTVFGTLSTGFSLPPR